MNTKGKVFFQKKIGDHLFEFVSFYLPIPLKFQCVEYRGYSIILVFLPQFLGKNNFFCFLTDGFYKFIYCSAFFKSKLSFFSVERETREKLGMNK